MRILVFVIYPFHFCKRMDDEQLIDALANIYIESLLSR